MKFIISCLIVFVSSASMALEISEDFSSRGLQLLVDRDYAAASLVISGASDTRSWQFGPNATIQAPAPEQDGSYTYELVLTPQLSAAELQRRLQLRASGNTDELDMLAQDQRASGSFSVQQGEVLQPIMDAGQNDGETAVSVPDPQPRVVLTNTDGVIRPSACVGNDCPDSPSFGFDTIRLQENNLRMHFDDTSSTASFPANDWRLVANDTSNGGRNYFAIEDSTSGRLVAQFEAGAPANALVLENDGDLGLGTLNPVVELHIVDGDTPTMRLDQDGSSGFGTQIWDIAGNETNFFVRDISNGSQLVFRLQPGAQDASLIVDNEGQVGVGSPNGASLEADATLHVRSRGIAGQPVMLVENSAADTALLTLADSGDMILSGTLAQLSRRDSKEHFLQVDHQTMLQAIKRLPISTWNYRHQPDQQRHLGPMAEDFYTAFGLGTDPEHIATSDMAAVALAASQALLLEVEARDLRINELEQRLSSMELMLQDLLRQSDSAHPPALQQLVNAE